MKNNQLVISDDDPPDSGKTVRKPNILNNMAILIVNAGSQKKRFILQKIKKLGLTTIVVNKKAETWAKAYVDHWILADNSNHAEAVQAAHNFIATHPAIKINGAVTFWEDDVLLCSRICDRFKFIGIPLSVAKKARNKFLFREFCAKNGLPTPRYAYIRSEQDIKGILQNLKFPFVIKPVFGSSSAYVMKVENEEELRNSFEYIKKSISENIESALTDGLDILVEEYIDGDEVDIDILMQNGKVKFYSITDNCQTKEPFFVETGQSIPSGLPPEEQTGLIEMAEETLEKMGVQSGCIHFEAKSTKNGPVPIEVNLRMGGDEVYSFVKGAWGVDLIENAVKIAFGIYVKIKKPAHPKKYLTGHYFLTDYSGIITQLDINDHQIKKQKSVEEIVFFKKIGDTVLVPPEGYEYLGWITTAGDNILDAQDNLKNALKHIKYDIARFQHASSIGKTYRKSDISFSSLKKSPSIRQKAKIEKIRQMSISHQRNLRIGIACNGYQSDDQTMAVEKELNAVGQNIQTTLQGLGYRTAFIDFNNAPNAINNLINSDIDLVFNVCERINESSLLEPHAASIFDVLQIPYTGSNPLTLGLCIDKIRVKKLLTYHNIPTAKWDYAHTLNDSIRDDLKYPLIVKPANTDNSIGITNDSVVTDKIGLKKQLEKIILEYKRPALIEEYIDGDEYDVAIMGSDYDDLRVLPLSRSIFNKMPEGYWHIYAYDSKRDSNEAYKSIVVQEPAKRISQKLKSLLAEIALDTYNILDCHDYGRVEIKVDRNNNPFVLELNPNPSIDKNYAFPRLSKLVGMSYGDFLEEIIRMTIERYKKNPPFYHLQY
ncbi:ATP-grasp domain-containing protein [Patescibacteria group bacterium]|nr:ATP-grasp domain-containing protein [Patescibacteria group bacterium]MBU4600465.1 ATP-grasp domain-containing protein [Patescibacteria group bacterium]MCG2697855.1 ATP-grasp domain-containing protein [Candidatus Parcubacteria bacterium]MCG2700627.1 ATP-grasp domain-containing protein [Candidatus Parcubacteria bacterium]